MSNWQALVIQKVDNAIHCKKITIQRITQLVSIIRIHWIVISPVDCAIEHLINRGQNYNVNVMDKRTSLTVRSSHVKNIGEVLHTTALKKSTHKASYEDATARCYWSIHELTVILPPRTMYD